MNTAPQVNDVEDAVADLMIAARKVASLTADLVAQNRIATEYLRHGRLTRDTTRMIERRQATSR